MGKTYRKEKNVSRARRLVNTHRDLPDYQDLIDEDDYYNSEEEEYYNGKINIRFEDEPPESKEDR